jgi:cysteinyl-tRNA synthetase
MSKSLGNFFTIREVLKQYDAEVIRYFILSSHYRSPLNYSDAHLDNAKSALTTLYTALRDIEVGEAAEGEHSQRFYRAMDDDFNSAEALAVLFELAREVNRRKGAGEDASGVAAELKALAGLLGLLQRDPEAFLQGEVGEGDMSDDEIRELIAERLHARNQKNWAESDRIRDELNEKGILLEDTPGGGTTWRRK